MTECESGGQCGERNGGGGHSLCHNLTPKAEDLNTSCDIIAGRRSQQNTAQVSGSCHRRRRHLPPPPAHELNIYIQWKDGTALSAGEDSRVEYLWNRIINILKYELMPLMLYCLSSCVILDNTNTCPVDCSAVKMQFKDYSICDLELGNFLSCTRINWTWS